MANLIIDGIRFKVQPGKNLLETCLSLGFDVPYFCWHPALGSVGACRQCAVKQFKDENDNQGKIIMSCMEPVSDNMIISLTDPEVIEFRKGVIEWLMINHPHDCPVCDEGGECHLQDMTVMTGHNYRRYRFNKRTYTNQYLGPFINHEMNRCIQCYRCVRFYRDYAGGHDLDVFSAHDNVYFGRHKDGRLENEFSGNLVEICPTGVFTDKTLKNHYTRKWDLTTAPSVCSHCSIGCNIIPGERYGSLRRIQSRYNSEVNGYFICDRGRFGYEHVNSGKRITSIEFRKNGPGMNNSGEEDSMSKIRSFIHGKMVGIGSPRASVESNFILKQLVGKENFFGGDNPQLFSLNQKILRILTEGNIHTPSLGDVGKSDAVFILGEDITNTAPMMALAVRQAALTQPVKRAGSIKIPEWNDKAVRVMIQDDKGPVYTITPYPTKLNEISSGSFSDTPDELARFGFAVAGFINENKSEIQISGKEYELAEKIALELKNADHPLIISGTGCMNEAVIEAAYNVARSLCDKKKTTSLSYVVPECNSMGLAMLTDRNFHQISPKERSGTLIILENDLYRRDREERIDDLLNDFDHIIVLDHLINETTEKADVIIPVGSFAESQGSYVNNEGRIQRFFRVFENNEVKKESWKWINRLSGEKLINNGNGNYDDLVLELAGKENYFRGVAKKFFHSGFRIAGQKIARQSARFSGRTAINAGRDVNEPVPPEDKDSPFNYTMEGFHGQPPSSLIPHFWSPGWNSIQSVNKYQIEVGGELHGKDPGIRLIEPGENTIMDYFRPGPKNIKKEGSFHVIPAYHIFGSDELSACSPPVKEISALPYAGLGPDDVKAVEIKEGEEVMVRQGVKKYFLPVKIIRGLPPQTLLIPSGLDGFYFDFMKSFVTVNSVNNE